MCYKALDLFRFVEELKNSQADFHLHAYVYFLFIVMASKKWTNEEIHIALEHLHVHKSKDSLRSVADTNEIPKNTLSDYRI